MYLFTMMMNKPKKLILIAAAGAAALAVASAAGASAKSGSLSLVAYSTPKPALAQIISAFNKTSQGQGVSFSQSYGPSTNQAKAVAAGQPADLVFLSTGDDVNLLVDAGLVSSKWSRMSYDGIAANSVVVFVLRNGNPKHIKSWADLLKPGVTVDTPNPFSSGSAKWNVMAAYGAERRLGKTDAQATAYVKQLFTHVVSQDTSASNAMNTFLSGKGDVLITYESEALNARLQGKNVQFVIPHQTMLIQLPVAVLLNSKNRDTANAFALFMKSVPAQKLFAQFGFRPVNPKVANLASVKKEFPQPSGLIRIDDKYIGGWRAVDKTWFDPKNGRMVKIEQGDGGPSSG
ncbi:MAG TPA: sulfate ABC transporter substrate-binding protein [Gaiellaceae bacterium]|jgi:sulfate transport system substrate-binding protein